MVHHKSKQYRKYLHGGYFATPETTLTVGTETDTLTPSTFQEETTTFTDTATSEGTTTMLENIANGENYSRSNKYRNPSSPFYYDETVTLTPTSESTTIDSTTETTLPLTEFTVTESSEPVTYTTPVEETTAGSGYGFYPRYDSFTCQSRNPYVHGGSASKGAYTHKKIYGSGINGNAHQTQISDAAKGWEDDFSRMLKSTVKTLENMLKGTPDNYGASTTSYKQNNSALKGLDFGSSNFSRKNNNSKKPLSNNYSSLSAFDTTPTDTVTDSSLDNPSSNYSTQDANLQRLLKQPGNTTVNGQGYSKHMHKPKYQGSYYDSLDFEL